MTITIDPPFVEYRVSVEPDPREHSIFGKMMFINSFGVEDFIQVRAETIEPVSIVPSMVTIKRSAEKTHRKEGIFLVYRSDGSPLGKVEPIDLEAIRKESRIFGGI